VKYPPGYTSHNRVKLIKGGADYFDLAERLINKAIHSLERPHRPGAETMLDKQSKGNTFDSYILIKYF